MEKLTQKPNGQWTLAKAEAQVFPRHLGSIDHANGKVHVFVSTDSHHKHLPGLHVGVAGSMEAKADPGSWSEGIHGAVKRAISDGYPRVILHEKMPGKPNQSTMKSEELDGAMSKSDELKITLAKLNENLKAERLRKDTPAQVGAAISAGMPGAGAGASGGGGFLSAAKDFFTGGGSVQGGAITNSIGAAVHKDDDKPDPPSPIVGGSVAGKAEKEVPKSMVGILGGGTTKPKVSTSPAASGRVRLAPMGTTKSGKRVMSLPSSEAHAKFSAADHAEASRMHMARVKELRDSKIGVHPDLIEHHAAAAKHHHQQMIAARDAARKR